MKKAPNHKKVRKLFKIKYPNTLNENGNFRLKFGEYGLKSLERVALSYEQLDAGRRILKKLLKKRGKYWLRLSP